MGQESYFSFKVCDNYHKKIKIQNKKSKEAYIITHFPVGKVKVL